MKSNKGITLVALVITIIVLLILAVVSISLVVGDNGVLTQAKSSAKKTDLASAESAFGLTLNSLQTKFLGETWVNDVNSTFYGSTTLGAIDTELQKNGYYIVSYNGKAWNATGAKSTTVMTTTANVKFVITEGKPTSTTNHTTTNTQYEVPVTFAAKSVTIGTMAVK